MIPLPISLHLDGIMSDALATCADQPEKDRIRFVRLVMAFAYANLRIEVVP